MRKRKFSKRSRRTSLDYLSEEGEAERVGGGAGSGAGEEAGEEVAGAEEENRLMSVEGLLVC